jgi:hypothetical protein
MLRRLLPQSLPNHPENPREKGVKMPGTKGNRNATRNGRYGWLALGSLPKGASYVRRCIGKLRRELEIAVQAKEGELGLYQAGLCQSVARHEGRVLLCVRWLRDRGERMSDMERLAYLREIGSATDSRDRCLRALGLDKPADPFAGLYSQPLPAVSGPANEEGEGKGGNGDATESGVGDVEGRESGGKSEGEKGVSC